ncbi:hypothetical protein IA938_08590 [Listeria welshimeri]|uniref:hypothetical protein n=1 Tax=Listeria welshimeri TaxID=1643 RepID=UPI001623332A|nr:hypothetical protein [Listeria welshimeri]MBC1362356.1 hypothetical protein [Listeria welshimeri]MBC1624717.1 hypothetical protein [Listeria welshimeri]MBC1671455.1 hypothetical protein [Listeria welshimeri]MBC2090152.1 hypothetical protein [Listeria welshimeri]MBF2560894.1 hypothetical protein [Listeria welshimeri]
MNAKNMQIDNFFRSISGDKLEKTFDKWSNLILDLEKFSEKTNVSEMNMMLKNVFMYGSSETVRVATLFQQFNYKVGKKERNKMDNWILMLLAAETICSLKFDFTGHKVDSMTLIRLKINDIEKPEVKEKAEEAMEFVKQLIKSN